ncbi:hypothetical protein OC834_007202 [Tilletia horrida]|nr:hypothetical protein OC834_007202 [Tilletia horrida]KAK0534210.1 hypothetical protein OC835_002747 [Tilletia horrida]
MCKVITWILVCKTCERFIRINAYEEVKCNDDDCTEDEFERIAEADYDCDDCQHEETG